MNSHKPKYSIAIIGGGITGLSTALSWLKLNPGKGNEVIILEKNNVAGGCVTTYSRKGYSFDTTQIIPDISDLLKFLDVNVDLIKFNGYYARLFLADTQTGSARIVNIPSSFKDFEEMLSKAFPEDYLPIKKFFSSCRKMHNELRFLKTEPKLYQLPGLLIKCPELIKYSNTTFGEFVSGFGFTNKELVRILDVFSSFSGLSANRCAALLTACAMVTTLNGSYRPAGNFIDFPQTIVKKLKDSNVEILTRCEVKKIIIENNTAKGVQLAGGEVIFAGNIVCTADTKVTYGDLIGYDQLRRADRKFSMKAEEIRMSPSAFTINLGLDDNIDLRSLGFNCGYNLLTSHADAHKDIFNAWEKGIEIRNDHCFHIAVISSSVHSGGKNSLTIRVVPALSDYWIDLKESDAEEYIRQKRIASEFYINKVEEYMIAGLREHIVYTDICTPATYKRYLNSPTGSQYDMMPVPSNFGKNRLKSRTPFKGLFVPKFSHGIWPSMQSGLQVIDMITGGKIMNGNSAFRS